MNYTIINETDFLKARNKIREAQKLGKPILFTSSDDELNRKIIEKEKIDILMPVLLERKDRQKQRDSGFNQVLAAIAKKKGITIGINLDELLNAREKEKVLARISQNIKICKKSSVKMKFISKEKKDVYDLKSLGLVLGMPTSATKEL